MAKHTLRQSQEAVRHFCVEGETVGCVPYGNGHINNTFLILCEKDGQSYRYILQAINTYVFKEPKKVMENIEKVTAYLRPRIEEERGVLTLVYTVGGRAYYVDPDKNFWRMYRFIEDSHCPEKVENTDEFYQCAYAFGKFQRDLIDFPADSLHETIVDFHNTPKRYRDFLAAVEADTEERRAGVEEEIRFVQERADFYPTLMEAYQAGRLPLRVTHNDTKSNNVMLDAETRQALCVLDLDTIMPGFSVNDFGDSIRFGASTAAEDEKDLSKVWLDLEMFDVYTKGFLDGCDGLLTEAEIELMPVGAKMMTIECGMRFLADYLSGDVYFKTAYPEHNLDRARTQFKLVADMEKHWDEMNAIVKKYSFT